ncbi:MAG: TonB-dependent receptor, partial [Hyphomonas sp. 34-62-18]
MCPRRNARQVLRKNLKCRIANDCHLPLSGTGFLQTERDQEQPMKRFIGVSAAALLAMTATATAQENETASDDTKVEETVIVTATRSSLPPSALPNTIQLIQSDELALQAQLTGSAVEVVSTLVPSFSPTREKLSGAGETL